MNFPKIQAYVIHGSTGCSCCKDQNFASGFKYLVQDVLDSVAYNKTRRLVSSQYSETGVYTVYRVELEILPDGRVILENRVLPGLELYWDGLEADEMSYIGTRVSEANVVDLPIPNF